MIFAAPAVLLILQIHWVLFSRSVCREMLFVAEKIARENIWCVEIFFSFYLLAEGNSGEHTFDSPVCEHYFASPWFLAA